jgi:nicotinamide-nucleotide amidase
MREIIAEIVTIGDEILYGQITDTNSQWLSEQLGLLGIKVKRKISVGDELPELLKIFEESESRADIVLLTGGLGPTSDDITKPALCDYFRCDLVMDQTVLDHVTDFFVKRGRPNMLEANKLQAAIPNLAKVLFNRLGTAPGLWIERKGKVFISLPGVPHEMKEIMISGGLPKLKAFFKPPLIVHRVIQTVGIGESFLAEKIKDWEQALPSFIRLAYLPSLGGVKLRLTAKDEDANRIEKELNAQEQLLQEIIGPHIYAIGEVELERAIGNLLKEKALTLSTAESCTGGALAASLTSIPGSSQYFMGSVVAYSNDVKIEQLGVQVNTLKKFGAVSEETVKEMAEGARLRLGTDIGISTSGVAGPSGGTEEKPVGTVWIGYSDKNITVAKKLQLGSDRMINIRLTVTLGLNFLRESLSVSGLA